MPTWVDQMRMVPLSATKAPSKSAVAQINDSSTNEHDSLEINIASFNILAESYLTPRSHPGLPENYANVAFNTTERRRLLLDTLERFCTNNKAHGSTSKMDILALQELDLLEPNDPILPAFTKWGYKVVKTSNKQRKDCCAIAFDKRKFNLIKFEIVQFDDLATLQSSSNNGEDGPKDGIDNSTIINKDRADETTTPITFHNIKPKRSKNNNSNNTQQPELTGMVRSFLRRNCAILAQLESKQTKQSIVVTSVHLYWNPSHEYVKLLQAKYLLDRVEAFASITEDVDEYTTRQQRISTIICGDMNSKPGSIVHRLFVESSVDARTVAPWRYFWDGDNEEMYTEEDEEKIEDIVASSSDNLPTKGEDESEEKNEPGGGYMMGGLPTDFIMYCGIIDSKPEKDDKPEDVGKIEENGTPSTNKQEDSDDDLSSNFDDLKLTLEWRRKHKHNTPQDYQHAMPPMSVKYVLDYTLNRFTRWLRILGIDATLETLEEEKERTSGGNM